MVVPRPHPPAGPEGGRRGPVRLTLALGAGLVLALVPTLTANAAPTPTPAASAFRDGDYVVTLARDPIATYDGSLPGLPQLKSAGGDLDMTRSTTQRYRDLLLSAQTKVADSVGVAPLQRYTVALNGFSAKLTGAQATKLATTAGVVSVAPDVERHLVTSSAEASAAASSVTTTTGSTSAASTATAPARTTADYLGLTGADGVWSRLGGVQQAGRGVVVADLDTGLWPEHPSVAGAALPTEAPAGEPYGAYRSGSTIRMAKADGGTYTGTCETGQRWTAASCTTKVVGARAFSDGYTAVHTLGEGEFTSARDSDGHGTHTATTAVGRNGVPATIDGDSYGDVTGIAPAAALAVYKVCWTGDDGTNGCQTSDLIAAIDQAVADNVDVINYSIGSGASSTAADPVEVAFMVAASAGIFVSASAGNSGPAVSTTEHASPWVTTVAAATSVLREGTVVLGDGRKFVGARLTQEPLPTTRLVLGSDVAAAGKTANDAAICLGGSLDPVKTKGKVVFCQRAVTARVDKSAEVARAGGVGMVLYNPTPNSLEPDAHAVPTVHLDAGAGKTLLGYLRTHRTNATVSFQPGNTTRTPTPAPQISAFSSRGPALVDGGDLLKPDLTAPGSGVVAGYSPVADGARGNLFAPESGTSMSAPHVTGLAALYYAAHPEFTPMTVKSALMTTARNLLGPDGTPALDPFAGGAGFVDPTKMLTPGLVYDSTPVDWLRYLEGSGVATGTGVGAIDPSELNQASIADGDLAGARTVTRTVTATTGGYYYATAQLAGFDVQVQPSVLKLDAGQSAQFRVTLTRTTAALNTWASGSLTWKGGDGLTVRSPIAVRPIPLAAPAEVAGTGAKGSVQVGVTPGFTGDLDLTTTGLVAGKRSAGSVAVGDSVEFPVTIPKGTTFSRFDLRGEAGSDVDLYLYSAAGELLDLSASASTDERIDSFVDPGNYVLVVDGYAPAPGTSSIGFTFTSFVLGPDAKAGTLAATPDPLTVTTGRQVTYTLAWSGLDPSTPYLGTVGYGDTTRSTVLTVG
ncbi:S8 family serine peptidase [Kineococcus sp. R86509]|uniref:S8 family serine peptidase n=1 Tax=Kineococcus sp. R86509 TaxID=3093851 RepID=UPI0036D20A14